LNEPVPSPSHGARWRWAPALLAVVVGARLATLAFYPLMDATEARYANIARVMLETGNWVTPQTSPGEVFWGKPPLYVWASAASMGLLGVNELGSRLPSFLFAVLTLAIVTSWAKAVAAREGVAATRDPATVAGLVLATCLGFFVSSGAVMTDASLIFATTWALAAFWMVCVHGDTRPRWRYGFFAALGIGLLAKGPVAVVLVGFPIGLWFLLHRRWSALRALPWVAGTALTLAIAVPWYIAAELRTPGFLRYFILGENLQRFLVPGWKGDRYGFTHAAPRGSVWLFFIASALPWSLMALPGTAVAMFRSRKLSLPDPAISFVVLATVAPLAFFTVSAHAIWTYALPSLPPFAVLLGLRLTSPSAVSRFARPGVVVASLLTVVLACTIVAESTWLDDNFSTRELYRAWEAARVRDPGPLVFEQHGVIASLLFYSDGQAKPHDPDENESLPHYDVYTNRQLEAFEGQPRECAHARTIVARVRDYVLVREVGMPSYCDVF